jgi:hypothetical protein
MIDDEEVDAIAIESSQTIEIDTIADRESLGGEHEKGIRRCRSRRG